MYVFICVCVCGPPPPNAISIQYTLSIYLIYLLLCVSPSNSMPLPCLRLRQSGLSLYLGFTAWTTPRGGWTHESIVILILLICWYVVYSGWHQWVPVRQAFGWTSPPLLAFTPGEWVTRPVLDSCWVGPCHTVAETQQITKNFPFRFVDDVLNMLGVTKGGHTSKFFKKQVKIYFKSSNLFVQFQYYYLTNMHK